MGNSPALVRNKHQKLLIPTSVINTLTTTMTDVKRFAMSRRVQTNIATRAKRMFRISSVVMTPIVTTLL